MDKIRETAKVISQECLCNGIYSMWIKTNAAEYAVAGQFISVYSKDSSKLLPRPISICEINKAEKTLRIVYRIAGEGTKEFSGYKAGDDIDIMGPLGNGYTVAGDDLTKSKKPLLIGGGIGIPPMLELARAMKRSGAKITIVAGYRSASDLFLVEELSNCGDLIIATDDGSKGFKGTVIDAIEDKGVMCDFIAACGPKPMLKGVKSLAGKMNVPAYISMEERMACGVGACLGCVCTSEDKDNHSKVNNKRVCKDGPVFNVSEVTL